MLAIAHAHLKPLGKMLTNPMVLSGIYARIMAENIARKIGRLLNMTQESARASKEYNPVFQLIITVEYP